MKRIAFVATREPEYSRVAITKRELNRFYELNQFVCSSKSYPLRMIVIAFKLLLSWMTFRLRKNEAIFVGFLRSRSCLWFDYYTEAPSSRTPIFHFTTRWLMINKK